MKTKEEKDFLSEYIDNLPKYQNNDELKDEINENLKNAEKSFENKVRRLFMENSAIDLALKKIYSRETTLTTDRLLHKYFNPSNLRFRRKEKIDKDYIASDLCREEYYKDIEMLRFLQELLDKGHGTSYMHRRYGKKASDIIFNKIGLFEEELWGVLSNLEQINNPRTLENKLNSVKEAKNNLDKERGELTKSAIRWAMRIASTYYNNPYFKNKPGLYPIDFKVIQSGALVGLCEAATGFVEEKGSFTNYSNERIKLGIRNAIKEELGHRKKLNILDLNKKIKKGEEKEIGDLIEDRKENPPGEYLERKAILNKVDKAINELNKKERKVLRLRYPKDGEQRDATLREIGITLGISRERVRQIESIAIKKLQKNIKRD